MLLDEWVPDPRVLERDEALGELALRFVRSHGPVTRQDLARWTGLTAGDARRAITLAGDALEPVDVGGTEMVVTAGLLRRRVGALSRGAAAAGVRRVHARLQGPRCDAVHRGVRAGGAGPQRGVQADRRGEGPGRRDLGPHPAQGQRRGRRSPRSPRSAGRPGRRCSAPWRSTGSTSVGNHGSPSSTPEAAAAASGALAAVEAIRPGVQAGELAGVGAAVRGDQLGDDRLDLVPVVCPQARRCRGCRAGRTRSPCCRPRAAPRCCAGRPRRRRRPAPRACGPGSTGRGTGCGGRRATRRCRTRSARDPSWSPAGA